MFKKKKVLKDECPICERRRNLEYGERSEIVKIRGEEIPVKVNAYYCTEGDHYFYDLQDEEDKYQTAYREFRQRKGMLQPDDIRHLREKYGLSQRAFAKLLGCSPITIQRYETGALQDDVHNNLLLILKDYHSFKHFFESKKSSLSEKISGTVEKKLREIDEKESQLEIDFVFKQARFENVEVDLSLLVSKSENREPLEPLLGVFPRLVAGQPFVGPDLVLKAAFFSRKPSKKKWAVKNGYFSTTAKGDLALAA
jgi:putative zinc finger/helix-turn-helix YgiT family protein